MNGTRYKGEDFTSKPTKYRLTEDWLEYKKGDEFFKRNGELWVVVDDDTDRYVARAIELSLLLKTGILEEVKEKSRKGVLQITFYDDANDHMMVLEDVLMSKEEALSASEKIKALLLSLKK